MAYPEQYRMRVVGYILEGHTQEEAKSVFKVGTTSIKRWLAAYKATGTTGGGYMKPGRPPRKIAPERLAAYMKKRPDAFLREIAQEFSCTVESAHQARRKGLWRRFGA